jgi:hypothetical protein
MTPGIRHTLLLTFLVTRYHPVLHIEHEGKFCTMGNRSYERPRLNYINSLLPRVFQGTRTILLVLLSRLWIYSFKMGDVTDVKDDTATVFKFEDVTPSTIRPEIAEQDRKLARRLLWKVDLWILPLLTVLYLITAMDRSDIGNAQVAGMQKAVGASSSEWAKVVSLFYVGFIVSQPFGSLFLRKLTPPILFGLGVTFWGAAVCPLPPPVLVCLQFGTAQASRIFYINGTTSNCCLLR